jgi:hypothetical protein
MLKRKRDDLAIASLRDLKALLVDAAPRLEKTPGAQPDSAEETSAIAEIESELSVVSAENLEPDGSTAADIAAINSAVQQAQLAVNQVEAEVDATPVVESPSPSPVIASRSAESSPAGTPSEPPTPEASSALTESPAAPPSEAPPAEVAPSP